MRLKVFQLIDLIVVKNQPIFLNDIFLTLMGLFNVIFQLTHLVRTVPRIPSHFQIQIRIGLVTLVMIQYGHLQCQ